MRLIFRGNKMDLSFKIIGWTVKTLLVRQVLSNLLFFGLFYNFDFVFFYTSYVRKLISRGSISAVRSFVRSRFCLKTFPFAIRFKTSSFQLYLPILNFNIPFWSGMFFSFLFFLFSLYFIIMIIKCYIPHKYFHEFLCNSFFCILY